MQDEINFRLKTISISIPTDLVIYGIYLFIYSFKTILKFILNQIKMDVLNKLFVIHFFFKEKV